MTELSSMASRKVVLVSFSLGGPVTGAQRPVLPLPIVWYQRSSSAFRLWFQRSFSAFRLWFLRSFSAIHWVSTVMICRLFSPPFQSRGLQHMQTKLKRCAALLSPPPPLSSLRFCVRSISRVTHAADATAPKR